MNEFKVFIGWISQYDFVSKELKPDDALKTEIELQHKKDKKPFKFVLSNPEAILFLKVWTLIQDESDGL